MILPVEIQQFIMDNGYAMQAVRTTGDLQTAFDWSITKEGHKFWYKIHKGLFTEFFDRYPTSYVSDEYEEWKKEKERERERKE